MKSYQKGFNPTYQEEAPTIDEVGKMIGFAVLEFGTNWCEHCIATIPAVRQILSGRALPHIKVLDGKGKTLGRSFKVKLWPTLILLESGREVARLVRPVHVDEVQEFLALAQ